MAHYMPEKKSLDRDLRTLAWSVRAMETMRGWTDADSARLHSRGYTGTEICACVARVEAHFERRWRLGPSSWRNQDQAVVRTTRLLDDPDDPDGFRF